MLELLSACGRSKNKVDPQDDLLLIHFGRNSSLGYFPWMAAIFMSLDAGRWEQVCGGTLISPQLVLSGNQLCLIFLRTKRLSRFLFVKNRRLTKFCLNQIIILAYVMALYIPIYQLRSGLMWRRFKIKSEFSDFKNCEVEFMSNWNNWNRESQIQKF